MAKQAEAQSALHVAGELGRDAVELQQFEFTSGKSSKLEATASLKHFAKPEWQATVKGSLELKQLSVLADVDGLNAGTVELDLKSHNCVTPPAVAQKHPPFWQRSHPKETAKPPRPLPPDPDCVAGYLLVGTAKIYKAAYRNEYVRLHDVDGSATLHMTPTELLLTALTGYLPGGGSAAGELRIANWLGEVPPKDVAASSATTKAAVTTANKTAKAIGAKEPIPDKTVKVPPVQTAHAYLTATLAKIPLRTIMDVTAPEHYGDLGFDTAVSGPVKVEWGGPAKNIADTVEVDGNLTFAPTGVKRPGALNDVPVTGQTLAHYSGKNETVRIQRITLQMPETNFEASGVLGVNLGDPLTDLRVDLTVRDLGGVQPAADDAGSGRQWKEGNGGDSCGAAWRDAVQRDGEGEDCGPGCEGALAGHECGVRAGDDGRADRFGGGRCGVFAELGSGGGEFDDQAGDGGAECRRARLCRGRWCRGAGWRRMCGMTEWRWMRRRNWRTRRWWMCLQIAGQQGKVPLTGTMALNGHAAGTAEELERRGACRAGERCGVWRAV